MIPRFVKEQHAYSLEDLRHVFSHEVKGKKELVDLDENKTKEYAKLLQEYGVLKRIALNPDNPDLSDISFEELVPIAEDIDGKQYRYVFTFVGLVCIAGYILQCYPKYIKKDEPKTEFKLVVQVLRKYEHSKQQDLQYHNSMEQPSLFNRLSVMLALLDDYYENGLYINDRLVREINGNGDIDWNRTINNTYPVIKDNKPYYVELVTRRRVNNENDFITLLHQCLLTEVSEDLGEDLRELLGLDAVDLTDQSRDDIGDDSYLEYRILQEMNQEFNTRKLSVLNTMLALISHKSNVSDDNNVSLFGTTAFNKVWEECCKVAFADKLDKTLADIGLKACSGSKVTDKLISIIQKPHWRIEEKCEGVKQFRHIFSKETLIPDIISVFEKPEKIFAILDAKYYRFELDGNKFRFGVPGIGDIDKQFLYHMAYKELINVNQITTVYNAFLMPTDEDVTVNKGHVSVAFFRNAFGQGTFPDIAIRLVPAEHMYKCYLNDTTYAIENLELDCTFEGKHRFDVDQKT